MEIKKINNEYYFCYKENKSLIKRKFNPKKITGYISHVITPFKSFYSLDKFSETGYTCINGITRIITEPYMIEIYQYELNKDLNSIRLKNKNEKIIKLSKEFILNLLYKKLS